MTKAYLAGKTTFHEFFPTLTSSLFAIDFKRKFFKTGKLAREQALQPILFFFLKRNHFQGLLRLRVVRVCKVQNYRISVELNHLPEGTIFGLLLEADSNFIQLMEGVREVLVDFEARPKIVCIFVKELRRILRFQEILKALRRSFPNSLLFYNRKATA
jgi:hypothetical protein